MKKILKVLLRKLGYQIYRIEEADLDIPDAISYNRQEAIDHFYAQEEQVVNYVSPTRLASFEYILSLSKSARSSTAPVNRLADVGCGTGHLLQLAIKQGLALHYYGFEYSAAARSIAQKNAPDAHFEAFDIYEGYSGEGFDQIYCISVLEHLTHPHKALEKLLNMCAAGGQVFLIVPNGRYDSFKGHIHFWSPESWGLFLEPFVKDGIELQTGQLEDFNEVYAILKKASV